MGLLHKAMARPSEAIALRWGDVDLRHRRIRIRRSRVLGEDARPKTGRSKRDLIAHEGLERVLRGHMPRRPAPEDFVFTTPRGTPIDEVNFYQREWLAALRALRIRPRPFYNCRHTYISTLLAAGGKPLFVCRQTGTSLEMIGKHYGDARVDAAHLDEMIGEFDQGFHESGRPGSNRRRPAWEAFSALAGQGIFGGGSRNGITQYDSVRSRFAISQARRSSVRVSPRSRARVVRRTK
ncbi:MAG: hypothetical protein E6J77_16775 [Deltaproteobacteria bacterium]|nr:MAG: hypothetical protein E6J77_16775 [Deltaproteobacteria bacterium]